MHEAPHAGPHIFKRGIPEDMAGRNNAQVTRQRAEEDRNKQEKCASDSLFLKYWVTCVKKLQKHKIFNQDRVTCVKKLQKQKIFNQNRVTCAKKLQKHNKDTE